MLFYWLQNAGKQRLRGFRLRLILNLSNTTERTKRRYSRKLCCTTDVYKRQGSQEALQLFLVAGGRLVFDCSEMLLLLSLIHI